MRTALNGLETTRRDGISEYNRLGLCVDAVPPNSFDEYRLRIVVSSFSSNSDIARNQAIALQEIIDEGADRGITVVADYLQ